MKKGNKKYMSQIISNTVVKEAILRVSSSLINNSDYLTSLDQKVGDGDMGITMSKIADTLSISIKVDEFKDIGNSLVALGLMINRAAASSIGTLISTALMRAGRVVLGKSELTALDLSAMLSAADSGIQERGKSKPGDKTIIDAINPANLSFSESIKKGEDIHTASIKALYAAQDGRDSVTNLRSRVGRASWLGERTEGAIDPGAEAFVLILKAIINFTD